MTLHIARLRKSLAEELLSCRKPSKGFIMQSGFAREVLIYSIISHEVRLSIISHYVISYTIATENYGIEVNTCPDCTMLTLLFVEKRQRNCGADLNRPGRIQKIGPLATSLRTISSYRVQSSTYCFRTWIVQGL